jgi:hypothetical protein
MVIGPLFSTFNFPEWKLEDYGLLIVGLVAYHALVVIFSVFVPIGIKNRIKYTKAKKSE